MTQTNVIEKAHPLESGDKRSGLVVVQPKELGDILASINAMSESAPSERIVEDKSGDLGGSASGKTAQTKKTISLREEAIARIPQELSVVRVKLQQHIKEEVKELQQEIRKAARRITKPGMAYRINELYARIRRLNALLTQLFEASYDILKRFFIRVFIDRQPII
ncbi:MAG: hypothetical protein V1926_00910 [Candidatus Peregrinibacteria bacterium]